MNVGSEQSLNKNSNFVQTLFKLCSNNVKIQTLFVLCSNSVVKVQWLFKLFRTCSLIVQNKKIKMRSIQTCSSNLFFKFKLCSKVKILFKLGSMWSIWKGLQITICTLFKYCSVKAQTLFKLFKLCSNIKQTSNKYQFYALVKYTLWMMFWGSTGWPITSGTSVRLVRFWLFYYSTRAVWHTSLGNSPDQSSQPRSKTWWVTLYSFRLWSFVNLP